MKSVTQDGRRSRWDAHREQRSRELLKDIRAAIRTLGAEATMDQISEATGTSKTVLYRYFGDRRGLQNAVGDWAMTVIRRSLDDVDRAANSPESAMRGMIGAFVRLAAGSPELYRFCNTAFDPADSGTARGFLAEVTDHLVDAMDLQGAEERMWATGSIGFVRACTEAWLMAPDDPEALTEKMFTWLQASRTTKEITA